MAGRGAAGGDPRRVLIVDDHPLWRETMRKVLTRRTAATQVLEAEDADAAFRTVRETPPDVVIMDLDLPSMDGVELTRRLCEEHTALPVVVLSASDRPEDVIAAVQAGASGYLVKTAGADEVVEAVRRVHDGELAFPPALAGVVVEEFRRRGEGAGAPTAGRAGPATRDPSDGAAPMGRFELEGDYWTIEFGGSVTRVADMNGMHDIALLLERPGSEVHVLDILGCRGGVEVSATAAPNQVLEADLRMDRHSTQPVLDGAAKRAYRARAAALEDELEEARSYGDEERAARARYELDTLIDELERAVGLGGRDRSLAASSAERARVNVTRAITRAIARIRPHDPSLAQHLERSITRGTFCVYAPERPIGWQVRSRGAARPSFP